MSEKSAHSKSSESQSQNSHRASDNGDWKRGKTSEPKLMRPPDVMIEQWLMKFHRKPLENRIYRIPGDIPIDLACHLLSSDPHLPKVLGMYHLEYTTDLAATKPEIPADGDTSMDTSDTAKKPTTATDRTRPYCTMLSLCRADGLTCSFNLDMLGGVPRHLRQLLKECNPLVLGFDFTDALENVDAEFKGLSVNLDLFHALTTIKNLNLLPNILSKTEIDIVTLACDLFVASAESVSELTNENDYIVCGSRAALCFDLYALLEQNYDALNRFLTECQQNGNTAPFVLPKPVLWSKLRATLESQLALPESVRSCSTAPPQQVPITCQTDPPHTQPIAQLAITVRPNPLPNKPANIPPYRASELAPTRISELEIQFACFLKRMFEDFRQNFNFAQNDQWNDQFTSFYEFWRGKMHAELNLPSGERFHKERRLKLAIQYRIAALANRR